MLVSNNYTSREPKMVDKISVVLPVFNEEENIEKVVSGVVDVFKNIFNYYEIIIINDGSTDGSPAIIERLRKVYKNLKVVNFEHNRGYGATLREGFKKASFDYVFYTDSDSQFDVSEVSDMLPLMDKCDMAIGFRVRRKDGITRLVSSWVYNKLTAGLLGLKVRDVNCSFKLFKREIIDSIQLYSNGFFIDAELLWKAKLSGYRICETGVSHYQRQKGVSKVRIRDTVTTTKELFEIVRKGNK